MGNIENHNEELNSKKLIEDLNNLEDDKNSKKAKLKEKLKKNSKIIIIVSLIVIALIYLVIYKFEDIYFYFYDNFVDDDLYSDFDLYLEEFNPESYDEEGRKAEIEKQKANINIKEIKDESDGIVLNIENNNETDMNDFEVYLIFYDENNKVIDVVSETVSYMAAGSLQFLNLCEEMPNYARYDTLIKKASSQSDYLEN